MADDAGNGNLLYHAVVEVSVRTPLHELRQIAIDACPDAEGLLQAQRSLLHQANSRLGTRNKKLTTDTETYRRLGILLPHWKYPELFEETLVCLRDYWRRHRRAPTLGHAAPYREVRDKAAEYLKLLAEGIDNVDGDDRDGGENAHLLPSPAMVYVFRLVNGNLEIPATLFKALTAAGRIQDNFFPDEPDTWHNNVAAQRGSPSYAGSVHSGYGRGGGDADVYTDASSVVSGGDVMSAAGSGVAGHYDNDDDAPFVAQNKRGQAVVKQEEDDDGAAILACTPQVVELLRQATQRFLHQISRTHGGGSAAAAAGATFTISPEIVRMLGGLGGLAAAAAATAASSPLHGMMPPPPIMVFCNGVAAEAAAMASAFQFYGQAVSGGSAGAATAAASAGHAGAGRAFRLLPASREKTKKHSSHSRAKGRSERASSSSSSSVGSGVSKHSHRSSSRASNNSPLLARYLNRIAAGSGSSSGSGSSAASSSRASGVSSSVAPGGSSNGRNTGTCTPLPDRRLPRSGHVPPGPFKKPAVKTYGSSLASSSSSHRAGGSRASISDAFEKTFGKFWDMD